MKLRIAIVVQGKFHAFFLGQELLRLGHDVVIFSRYPKWKIRQFDFPPERSQSFWFHGAWFWFLGLLREWLGTPYPEAWFHISFGRWAAERVSREEWDVVLCWSQAGEEVFRKMAGRRALRICHRTSAHIRVQSRILEEEERRVGVPLERPSRWAIDREEKEYELADLICGVSTFVRESFLSEGFPPGKIESLLLGVHRDSFRSGPQAAEFRRVRILSGKPLRILNVGTFSFRKGAWDMAEIIRNLPQDRFEFHFVGSVSPEARKIANALRPLFTRFIPRQPEAALVDYYREADLFILPTLEDGYSYPLAQALAAGIPVLTTSHSAGYDLVQDNYNGWVLPIRFSKQWIDRLRWCDEHRDQLAQMVRNTAQDTTLRGWEDVAADFEKIIARTHQGFRSEGADLR